jgi:MCP family monocarboxylic acid transporter-like MFS transporter 9
MKLGYELYIHTISMRLTFFSVCLSGWFYDWTQTYDIAFYFSGFCVLLGGFVLLLASFPCWDICNKQLPKPTPTTFLYKVASNV